MPDMHLSSKSSRSDQTGTCLVASDAMPYRQGPLGDSEEGYKVGAAACSGTNLTHA